MRVSHPDAYADTFAQREKEVKRQPYHHAELVLIAKEELKLPASTVHANIALAATGVLRERMSRLAK